MERLTHHNTASPTISYGYTGQKLTQVDHYIDVGVTESHLLGYDASYRVATETQAGRGVLTRSYDAADRVASTTVQTGPTATYAYYPDGSVNTILWTPVSGQFKYTYTLPGQYQQIAFPNGQTRNFAYDDQGRLTSLSNLAPGAVNIASYGYGYDLNYTTGANTMLGQRVSMTATVPSQGLSGSLSQYEYDPLYQLVKTTYPAAAPFNGEVDAWTYDALGNRLTSTVNGATTAYSYYKVPGNANNWQRLTSDGVNSYSYQPSQTVATRTGPSGTFTFWQDYWARITGISGATTASYGYDHQGRRSSKTVSGVTNTYLYDGLNLIRETGATPAEYLFGPGIDEPLAMSRGGQVYYYDTDALGSVTAVTDTAGTVQNGYVYDAWGQTRSQTGTLPNPFAYTSREQGEAGTLFYRARFYQPGIGRFLQEDPDWGNQLRSGIPRSSGYAAMLNNTLAYTDPTGLDARTCCRPFKGDNIPIVGAYASSKNHCYVETTGGSRGRRTYGLHNLNGTAMFQRDEPTDTGGTCTPWRPDPDCKLDRCLQAAAASYPVLPYSTFSAITGIGSGANSNTFANGITAKCGLYVDPYAHAHSPGWYQPVPGGR